MTPHGEPEGTSAEFGGEPSEAAYLQIILSEVFYSQIVPLDDVNRP
jgi:hypothetical protein